MSTRGWIATKGDRVLHLSEADGWKVDQVYGPFPRIDHYGIVHDPIYTCDLCDPLEPAVAREAEWKRGNADDFLRDIGADPGQAQQSQAECDCSVEYMNYVRSAEQAPDVARLPAKVMCGHCSGDFHAELADRATVWCPHCGKAQWYEVVCHPDTAPPAEQAPEPLCGLSWSGHNIKGDRASIDAAKEALHAASTVPHLRERIRAAEQAPDTMKERCAKIAEALFDEVKYGSENTDRYIAMRDAGRAIASFIRNLKT